MRINCCAYDKQKEGFTFSLTHLFFSTLFPDITFYKLFVDFSQDSKYLFSLFITAKRVTSFIQQGIFSRLTEPLKVPVGMSVMEQELAEICGQFLRLISHNRSVFGNFYADIIGTLLKRQQEDLSPRPT